MTDDRATDPDTPADRSGLVLHGIGASPGVAVARLRWADELPDTAGADEAPGTGNRAAGSGTAGALEAERPPDTTGAGRGGDSVAGPDIANGPGALGAPEAQRTPGTSDAGAGGAANARGDPRTVGASGPVHGDPMRSVVAALSAVAGELRDLADRLRAEDRPEQADVVDAGALIAQDPALAELAGEFAVRGLTAAEAVTAATNRHADALAALGDPMFADRATDVRQIGRRAAAWLRGAARPAVDAGDVVLVGHELAAADVLAGGRSPVAVVSELGGPTGHLAVVARALGVPLVLGTDVSRLRGADARRVLVDGDRGLVVVDPVVQDVVPDFAIPDAAEPHDPRDRGVRPDGADARAADGPAMPDSRTSPGGTRRAVDDAEARPVRTRDGRRVHLYANVGGYREAVQARAEGAEGIGLLRTELPFLAADHWPDPDEFAAVLVPLFRDGPEGPVVVRTLDFTGDKLPRFLTGPPDAHRSDPILRTQFTGILTAAATALRPVRILVPMVTGATDFARCRHLLADVCRRTGAAHPKLGAMVEHPGAVAEAEALAACADFLALGTNDLTGAVLGLARHDPALTSARTGEPAVLHAIRRVLAGAHRHGRAVSVCGDAAADPRVLPLLIGLGIDVLSVAPPALAPVREHLGGLDTTRCAELARERLGQA